MFCVGVCNGEFCMRSPAMVGTESLVGVFACLCVCTIGVEMFECMLVCCVHSLSISLSMSVSESDIVIVVFVCGFSFVLGTAAPLGVELGALNLGVDCLCSSVGVSGVCTCALVTFVCVGFVEFVGSLRCSELLALGAEYTVELIPEHVTCGASALPPRQPQPHILVSHI